MPKIRINDLSRELEIKSRQALDFLRQRGHTVYSHSSSINEPLVQEVRAHFTDPARRSERRPVIDLGGVTPRAVGDPGQALTPAFSQAPQKKIRKKKKKTAKQKQCFTCHRYVPKKEYDAHVLKHRRDAWKARERAKPAITLQSSVHSAILPKFRLDVILPSVPRSAPPLPLEKMCLECHRLVHPAAMDQHMRDHRAHPTLPDIRSARFSFVILPPGHDWDYRTVFEHYRRFSRAHSFEHNVIDWTRIEKIQKHLKPMLKSFGVKGWFGYAVYEFPYTKRVVVECPIEGNATYILWGDWQNKVQLTKGELRHKYPSQHIRVIHQGNWIEDVRRALMDG